MTSFANAGGGDILFGVREQRDAAGKATGLPQDAPDLAGANADAEIRRLDAIIASGVAPRIPAVQLRAVDGFANGPVVVLRVPRSWVGPHQITLQQWSRFSSRNNAGKYLLEVQEIRAAFAVSDALPERLRRFRDDRLARLVGGETPVPLDRDQWAVLHLLPVASLEPGAVVDLRAIDSNRARGRPIAATGWNHRFNLDGVCTWAGPHDRAQTRAYAQLFRAGMVEAVAAGLVDSHPQHGRIVRVESFETYTLESAHEYIAALDTIGSRPPYVLLASLFGTKDARLAVPQGWDFESDTNRIDRDILTLPEVWLEQSDVDLNAALRPLFDSVWQAAGWPQSCCYDEAGKRISLR